MKRLIEQIVLGLLVLSCLAAVAWWGYAKITNPVVTVEEFDRLEVLRLTAQIERLTEHRNTMIAYLGRKHNLDVARYNYEVQKGQFVPKELNPQ